jgi:hypothetical protein
MIQHTKARTVKQQGKQHTKTRNPNPPKKRRRNKQTKDKQTNISDGTKPHIAFSPAWVPIGRSTPATRSAAVPFPKIASATNLGSDGFGVQVVGDHELCEIADHL